MTGYTFSQLIDFTRTSAATFVNSSGNIAVTPQSRNLLTFTNEFANAAWTKTNATISANSVAAPDGTMTADTLTASAGNGTVLQTFTASAVPYTFSIWLRRLTGTGDVQLTVDGTTFATVAVTSEWTRFSATLTPSAGSRTAGVRIVTSADAVYAWGAQLEQSATLTDYTRNFGGLFPPRFDYDPVSLAPRGLLIEEQRTNLLLRSEEFDNASWTKTAASISANATTSPDGTTDADKLVENTANTGHFTFQAATTTAASHTFSVYAKADGRSFILLYHDTSNSGAIFNLSNGAITTPSGVPLATATATAAGNGWYRCAITVTATAASNLFRIQLADTSTNYSYLGDGTSGIFIYGAQLEAGAFATSYIPTVASQVTRSADVAAINAPNFAPWYNQSEGTFVADFDIVSVVADTSRVLGTSDGTTNNRALMVGVSSTSLRGRVVVGGVDQASIDVTTGTLTTGTHKSAFAYKANDFALVVDAGTPGTDASGTVPTVDRLALGKNEVSDISQLNGHLRSIRYYPTRLTNAQLQALTA